MKSIKKNVLRPFLFIGLGVAITTIAIASGYDVPGKPGTPCIEDYGKDFCVINYIEPSDDGGASIKGYLIECKDKYGPWEDKGTSRTLKYRAIGMQEGHTVEFRVKAENKAGFGEPSDPSYPVTFKPR